MVSIIIPSYKDPLLSKTVESLLVNCRGEMEVICVMDGYWQAPVDDPRVKVVHIGKNSGMREAINYGVSVSNGEYIMRTDEHCIFGEGYDVILTREMKDNWIVTPRRFFLDPVEWDVMDISPVDYSNLIIDDTSGARKFSSVRATKFAKERKDLMIDETFAMQGSCWFMKKSWWDKVIVRLQTEGYGPLYQDSVEMVFKTWKCGGKLMVNKNTWYAHKHREFNRKHHTSREASIDHWKYSLSVWEDYYNELVAAGKINKYVLKEFNKYEKHGAYHWKQYDDKGTKYSRHADRVKSWVTEKNVLDIGAGDGKITSMLDAVGIDSDPVGVKLAQEMGANVILGDACDLPFKDGEFDAAFIGDVLEHLPTPSVALREAWRVITYFLYVSVPEKGTNNDPFHYQEWTPDELKCLVEKEGFTLDGDIFEVPKDKRIYGKFRKQV